MTRSVYYDPFGMRLAGYRLGQGDEVNLQDQTRRARASDYDYNTLAPLRLQGMQREENFANYYDPYRRKAAQYADTMSQGNVFDAERARRENIAMTNGNWGLPESYDNTRYPAQSVGVQHPTPTPTNNAWNDLLGVMQQEGWDTTDPATYSNPTIQHYISSYEKMYGLAPGTLGATNTQRNVAPPSNIMSYTDPATGQTYQYVTDPHAYEQRAWMPQAQQFAEFGLRQQQLQNSAGYQDLQRQYLSGKVENQQQQQDATDGGNDMYFLQ